MLASPRFHTYAPTLSPFPRYLVYDIMRLNDRPMTHEPFERRYKAVEEEVLRPRLQVRGAVEVGAG